MSCRSWRRTVHTIAIAFGIALAISGPTRPALASAAVQEPATIESLMAAGQRLTASQRYDDALRQYEDALALARAQARESAIARALLGRADVRLRLRQAALAGEDAREARAISQRLDDSAGIAQAARTLSAAEAALGNNELARSLITDARDRFAAIGDHLAAASAGLRLAGLIRDGSDEQVLVFNR